MGKISLSEEYAKEDFSVFSDRFVKHRRLILVPDGVNTIEVE